MIGFIAAVVAAILQGAASSLQARGAVTARGVAMLSPLFLIGIGADGVGWLVSLAALATLPLMVVEPILAGSLVVTLIVNRWLLAQRPTVWGWSSAGVIVVAAAVLAFSGEPGPSHADDGVVMLVLAGCAALLAVAVVIGYRRRWGARMAALGGLGFAGSAIAARGLSFDGWGVLTQPALWLLVCFGLMGTLAFARGLECAGAAGATGATAWMWVLEISVPSVAGLLVLGDRLNPGWAVPAAVALPVALIGAVAISSPRATHKAREGGEAS